MPRPTPDSAAATIAQDCLAVRVRLLSRAVTSIFDECLREFGMTTAQLNILVATQRLGEPSAVEVGARLHLEKSTLSRNLDRLVERAWVARKPGETARQHRLVVTRQGRALLVKALPGWKAAQARAEALLGAAGTRSLLKAGDRLLGP